MKLRTLAMVIASAVIITGCDKKAVEPSDVTLQNETPLELTTQDQKISYIFGHNIGGQFKAEELNIDVNVFARGVREALDGTQPSLSEDDIKVVLQAFQEQKTAQQKKMFEEVAEKNKAAGDAFLAENGKKEGVVTLESGLQYKVLTEGTGATPSEDSTVQVNYRGTLVDGTEFDSSYKRGVPATFGVTQVIPGWTEALMLMKEGGKWEIYIPPTLAYGPGGAGGHIGPESTLVFEVELLKANVEMEEENSAAE